MLVSPVKPKMPLTCVRQTVDERPSCEAPAKSVDSRASTRTARSTRHRTPPEHRHDLAGGGCAQKAMHTLVLPTAATAAANRQQRRASCCNTVTHTHLVEGDPLLDLQDVGVQMTDVVHVREDERFLEVEATGDNVLGVLECKAVALLQLQVLRTRRPRTPPSAANHEGEPREGRLCGRTAVQVEGHVSAAALSPHFELVLLVVRELDDQRHVESLLQPLSEHERHQVAHVQGL
jgi:hypothetical protein